MIIVAETQINGEFFDIEAHTLRGIMFGVLRGIKRAGYTDGEVEITWKVLDD